ncbi:dachshund homolog 1 isoform X2 [Oncorhynchus mykiss]|uniref:dachshund homolog 1 isoform X2 n=1 Tax=Oncorhynchus mykiss TaxID=8022 RepID=UPI001878F813|nr:dachshund homolog 1 isoform X2 [Oncorhynchus mykiss]
MASPAALMPSVPLVQPPPIQTSPATNSPPPATTSSSPSPSIAPTGLNPFSADLLPVPVGSPGAPVDVLPCKPVYSTPSPVENTPQNNEVKMVEVRGAKLASFTVKDNELICLPQAFDLFLKHLVGGLHTVYTKLKRLQITPVVCNVEQVRILRGLGAIQPGVNRCKLISRRDFETLYNDCTNASSRPGRPPKRAQSMTSSENQHLLSHSVSGLMSAGIMPPTGLTAAALAEAMKTKKIKLEVMGGYHSNHHQHHHHHGTDGENGGDHHNSSSLGLEHLPFMMMSHPLIPVSMAPASVSMAMSQMNHLNTLASMASAAQVHHSTLSSRGRMVTSVIKERVRDSPSPSLEDGRRSGSHLSSRHSSSISSSPVHTEHSADRTHVQQNGLSSSHALLGLSPSAVPGPKEGDVATLDSGHEAKRNHVERDDCGSLSTQTVRESIREPFREPVREPIGDGYERLLFSGQKLPAGFPGPFIFPEGLSSIETLLTNIQGLLKVAIDNTRAQDKQVQTEKSELKMELFRERELRETLERQLTMEQKNRVLIQKRLKKEKKSKRKLQEALQFECKLRDHAEQTLQQTVASDRALCDSLTQEVDNGSQGNGRTDAEAAIQDGRLFLKTTVMY